MTYSRVEKYHNQKNKKIKKGLATALLSSVLIAPFALSTTQVVNAESVSNDNSVIAWKANSVSTIKDQMKDQGLDLAHVSGKYVVRQGDTLSGIAQAADESIEKIASDNNIKNLDLIYVGQVLNLNADGQGTVGLSSTGVAGNPAISSDAATIMNGNKVTGTGTVVAQTPKTKAQMQATSMINAGVKPNVETTAAKDGQIAPTGNKADTASNTQAGNAGSQAGSNGATSGNANAGVNTGSNAGSTTAGSQTVNAGTSGTTSSSQNDTASGSQTGSNTGNADSNTGNSGSSDTQKPSVDYEKGVVNSDGTTNYDAAKNQQGPWTDKDSTNKDDFGNSDASKAWQDAHPNAEMTGQTYADGSTSQTPVYAGDDDPFENKERPQMTDQQLQDANQEMQNNIDASKTFGNGIQWVSSDYQGEVTGSQQITVDNPVDTPYENYGQHAGQIDAGVVNSAYGAEGSNTANSIYNTDKAPEGSHYVSSTITNGGQINGVNANNVNLTFYK